MQGDSGLPTGPADWSSRWAPYSDDTYRDALAALRPGQTILDIGAGDLRFGRRAAAAGCRVFAVENQMSVVQRGLERGPLPESLSVVIADARDWPFPPGLDAAVLLMRHCTDYALYTRKLRAVGCPLLITNARWRLGVEAVPLASGEPYRADRPGWFACVRCGHTGFTPGDPALITPEVAEQVRNVEGCPACIEQSVEGRLFG